MTEEGKSVHRSVLLNETIEGLNLSGDGSGQTILDATFGGGGHSLAILEKYPQVKVIAMDADAGVWERIKDKPKNISFHNENFRNLDKVLGEQKANGMIFDLGLSSDQLEDSGRGFSFRKDEPLFMTMKEKPSSEDVTALDAVNTWDEENLKKIIFGYGEERFAGRIARGIREERERGEIKTTFDLVRTIEKSVPASYRRGRLHFATRTFQALRIAVNDELGALEEALPKAINALAPEGRLAIITFHSLEDRIVKRYFRQRANEGSVKLINKKPITPSEEEIKENPRSRSAKLRVLEKII